MALMHHVVVGTGSPPIAFVHGFDFVRAKVPAARIEVLADVGHFPQLDAPAETNKVLGSFLATLA